jgi:ATP-dependent helicase/nuclease subunit B
VQARFLLGPAGIGKTYRCLAEIREELWRSPEGPPLILLVPKQATFQLERQLLGCGECSCKLFTNFTVPPGVSSNQIFGYTRLHILSFERLAQFVFDQLRVPQPEALSEEGRVMVLRALLMQWQSELKIFRAAARLNGFAQQLSLLLREFQRHHLSPSRLDKLAANPDLTPHLRDKLHDLTLLLRAYADWLKSHRLRDANDLLDSAGESLRTPRSAFRVSTLWLDGFAEMTPQELELLATVLPFCERATLAFCLEYEPQSDPSWLSTWSVVGQTFRRCHARLKSVEDCEVKVEELVRESNRGRFATNGVLQNLEASWSVGTRSTVSQTSIPKKNGDAVERIPTNPSPAVRLVTCADPEAETILAAREILQFVRTGGRYRDCAAIVRDLEPYHATLGRVFRRYQIPFFMDRREPVAHHPLAELTRFACRTVAFGWRHNDWFGALKSGLAPVRENEIDELENEALARGWEGKVWHSPLSSRTESASIERFEKLRRRLMPPFEQLATDLSAPNGAQVAAALRRFWDALKLEDTLEEWNAASSEKSSIGIPQSSIHSTVLDQMHDWLDNLELAFPTETLPLREWLLILEAGLANLTVGVIPPALDQVLIGAVDRSRNPDLKLALVLGLNEGVFPAAPVPSVLLTDAERAALPPDVFLGPTNRQCLGHERYLAYIACTRASQRLVLTRALRDADGQPLNPSPFFEHVKQLTGVNEENFISPAPWRESEHVCELAAPVLAAANVRRRVSGEPPIPPPDGGGCIEQAQASLLQLAESPVFKALVAKCQAIQAAAAAQNLAPTTIEKLFGHELASSVSGLEDFAACPFKFFAARGLRLEERKQFQFNDRDKGSFQHEVLREFHRRVRATGRLWRHLNAPEAIIIMNDIARYLLPEFEGGKLLADGAARFTSETLIERLEQLVGVLVEWMTQYEFDPTRVELGFGLGAPEDMPAWRLELPEARALLLRGRIDRVDLCHLNEETALAVVMDYKSRTRKLHPVKLHHGLELQLLSYLGVLRHLSDPKTFFGVQKLVPAGVFYVPLNGGGGRTAGSRADALTTSIQDQRTAYQHNGRFIADELEHFDNRGELKGDQFKYAKKKNGGFSARGNDALSKSEFEALREKIEGHLRNYASRIFAGEAAVSPFRVGNQTACDYCDFRAVCRFDPWTQPFRVLRPPPKPAKKHPLENVKLCE